MTDNKYTNEEIISSLEVIATTGNCDECKIRNGKWGTCNCSQITANAALDLINHQKAEIERLKRNYDALKYQENLSNRHCRNICEPKYKAEIERLKENLNIELEKYATEYDNTIKAEAYKEFAERLKSYLLLNKKGEMSVISFENVDTLLKEMVGEEK